MCERHAWHHGHSSLREGRGRGLPASPTAIRLLPISVGLPRRVHIGPTTKTTTYVGAEQGISASWTCRCVLVATDRAHSATGECQVLSDCARTQATISVRLSKSSLVSDVFHMCFGMRREMTRLAARITSGLWFGSQGRRNQAYQSRLDGEREGWGA